MKRIGIDLGSSSLGWVETEDGKIVKKGVVRFETGMSKGQSGGYVSPTRERREARSKRNLIRARKYRKWELLEVLIDGGFVPLTKTELETWSKYKKDGIRKFPENELFLKWLACDFTYIEDGKNYKNPYELRVKALENQLSKHELGRALYHLVQRRGYKDIGETDTETEKQIARRGESGFQKALDENDKIISKALLNEFLNKNKRARNQYPYRDEYRYEFEEICKAQGYDVSKYDDKDGSYNNSFIKKLWKAIIWQRDLRTQKGNIGKCTLEHKKLRCPISHPVFEIFRTWSFINTIKYYDENNEKQFIAPEYRKELFDWFLKKDQNFKFEKIKDFLNKKYGISTKYNYPITKNKKGEEIYDTSVSGMPVCKGLIDVFGEQAREALDIVEFQNTTQKDKCGGFGNAFKVISNYSIFDLWHILFSFDEKTAKDKNFLTEFATEKLNQQKENQIDVNKFVKLKDRFLQGYADLSVNAMCKIIPFLKEGYLYNEAVVIAKMPELLGENWEEYKDKIVNSVKEANNIYEWNKLVVGITNNLIDKWKGTKEDEQIPHKKDTAYILDDYDFRVITEVCKNNIGENLWAKRKDKTEIIEAVKKQYQEFCFDEKRKYRELITLTDIFNEKLKSLNIDIDAKQLYHHSNTENIYLKKCKINKETDKKELPKAKNKNGFDVEILPQVQIDSIKNPMFNKSMSILRRLMNEFIKNGEVDKETEIVIELARELNDNNKRSAIEDYQRDRENNRKKYREFLEEFTKNENLNLNIEESIPTFELWTEQTFEKAVDENGNEIINKNRLEILKEKDAIKRYELWTEQKGLCMYTGKMISLTKLFSKEIEIMHTIPRSILPDNTMANITVGYSRYNRDLQKQRFPKECDNYYKDVDGWGTSIAPRLKNWQELRDDYKNKYKDREKAKGNEDEKTKNKRIKEKHFWKMHYDYWKDKVERFEATEVKDSWARRQLVDTQMVSKYAREFLKTYFMKVSVQKGIVTAVFRKLFGFQEEDEIKSRNQHTHHAIDALVLTLIPTNSSYRERILKEYFKAIENNEKEKIKAIRQNEIPQSFNVQKFITDIENSTLIYNYENDKITKQTSKIVRKRGVKQYLKDKNGKFILDGNKEKILLRAKGDTVRSELYAQTYLGKIRDVERFDDGQPKRENGDWKYKTGKDEFCFVKRENIDKVKASDSLISSIIDPVIRELVRKQKNNSEIKDYQGNIIRHIRIQTKAGREVKERLNYRSEHNYKNKFYAEAGSIPYAILLQQFNKNEIKREMLPIASYEIAKAYKKTGGFDIEKYIQEEKPEFITWNKQLLKVGQKVLVLKEDIDYEKRNNIDFQRNRLYVITQFSEGSIWLQYHLCALSKDEVKNVVSLAKDELLYRYEQKYEIPAVVEDLSILDNRARKEDFENRKYRFDAIDKSFRLKRLSEIIGIAKTKEIKKELDKFKAIPSIIEIEGQTHLLKMSKENWNFLVEDKDFEMNIDGTIKWKE